MCELTIWLSKITTAIYEAGESYHGPRAVATVTRDRWAKTEKTRTSPETIPEKNMGCISASVPFSLLKWRIQSSDDV